MNAFVSFLTEYTIDGIQLWIVLLVCCGIFLASFVDSIAGGGGVISVPVYLLAFHGLPSYYVLGTNKLSCCTGMFFSTGRYIKSGYVNWRLCLPAAGLSLLGSVVGLRLQLHTPEAILKYLLLAVLPVVAFFTLRTRVWPDEPGEIDSRKQALIVWGASLLIGMYDGYYGPGTGTFLMILLIRAAKLDVRHAVGGTKVINLASNVGAMVSALAAGTVLVRVGLIASVVSIAAHYIGSGVAIKNGSKIVRPIIILVLILLTVKVGSEVLFPEFWS